MTVPAIIGLFSALQDSEVNGMIVPHRKIFPIDIMLSHPEADSLHERHV
jgi:hypothetical protein